MTPEQRAKHNAYHRKYRKAIYYPNNKAKVIAYAKAYIKKYPDKHKAAMKRYYKKNKEQFAMYQVLRYWAKKDKAW